MIEHAGGRVVFAAADEVPWTDTADVVVVGSGAAGWAAALAARSAGADVLVLEKLGQVGGTTAKAGGEAGGRGGSATPHSCARTSPAGRRAPGGLKPGARLPRGPGRHRGRAQGVGRDLAQGH